MKTSITYQAGNQLVELSAAYKRTGAPLDMGEFKSFCVHEYNAARAHEDIDTLMALISERYPEVSVSACWH